MSKKEDVKEIILGDEDLNELIEGIKNRRAPRFVLFGCTGAGKSALINAITGEYCAEESVVEAGTNTAELYESYSDGEKMFEIVDTRGIGESSAGATANQTPKEAIDEVADDFHPDAILFVTKGDDRAYTEEDVETLYEISGKFRHEIPLVAVITNVDKLSPSEEVHPDDYSERKFEVIQDKVSQVKRDLFSNGFEEEQLLDVVPVSSKIRWDHPKPEELDRTEQRRLTIEKDYRYNIDTLIDLLYDNVEIDAAIQLMTATRLDKATHKLSKSLTSGFSGVAGTIGAEPIPFADIAILVPLQATMITAIAYLHGKDFNWEDSKDLVKSISGAGGVGWGLRQFFRGTVKFLPVAGSAASAGIAAAGTYGMGVSASLYFQGQIDESNLTSKAKELAKDYFNRNIEGDE